MRIRRILLAVLVLGASALAVSELVGYTTIHKSAIDLRFWRQWSRPPESPAPDMPPEAVYPEDIGGIREDEQGGDSDGRGSHGAPDSPGIESDLGSQQGVTPNPSSLCSCEYEARVLQLQTPYMVGDDVGSLQNALRMLGYYSGPIDGVYTPETAAAVRHLQANQSLKVDGIVGRDTVDAIGSLVYRDAPNEDSMSVAEFAESPV